MIEGNPRCVIVANGAYVTLPMLNWAVPDAEDLKKNSPSPRIIIRRKSSRISNAARCSIGSTRISARMRWSTGR